MHGEHHREVTLGAAGLCGVRAPAVVAHARPQERAELACAQLCLAARAADASGALDHALHYRRGRHLQARAADDVRRRRGARPRAAVRGIDRLRDL